MDPELNRRIGRATSTLARLTKRVWENSKLTTNSKMAVYRACVLSTLLYGSESWTLYARQEKRLNSFHMRNLRRILGIKWSDYITNNEVLELANIPSNCTPFSVSLVFDFSGTFAGCCMAGFPRTCCMGNLLLEREVRRLKQGLRRGEEKLRTAAEDKES